MKYYPESKQSKSPEGCPSLGVAPQNDCRSKQTLTTGSRARARTGNDGQMPLIFPHQCSLSLVTKPCSGLCPETGAGVGPQEVLPGLMARTFHRGSNAWFPRTGLAALPTRSGLWVSLSREQICLNHRCTLTAWGFLMNIS